MIIFNEDKIMKKQSVFSFEMSNFNVANSCSIIYYL